MKPSLAALALLVLTSAASAQDTGASPPVLTTTTELRVFETWVQERRPALEEQTAALRASAQTTQTASVPGLVETLERQAASLEGTTNILSQQVSTLQESGNLRLQRDQVQGQLAEQREKGFPEAPPYSILRLDRARDELAAEQARRPSLQAAREVAGRLRGRAQSQLEEARKAMADAARDLAANTDPTRSPVLMAGKRAREADARRLEEVIRLRELEVANEALEFEIHELRGTLLGERVEWIEKSVAFAPADLEAVRLELEKRQFELQRNLDSLRLEASAAEKRWAAARQRLDTATDSEEVLAEEVQTRFTELQARQRQVVILETRLRLLERSGEIWSERYRIATEDLDLAAARTIETTLKEGLEALARGRQLQEARTNELQRDRLALQGHIDGLPVRGTRLERLLRERAAALDSWIEAGRQNLASLEALEALHRKVLAEVHIEVADVAPPGWRQRLGELWSAVAESSFGSLLRPALRVFLLLFLGVPLNYMISRRVQNITKELYTAQSGMVMGKTFYYTGMSLIGVFFLNEIGVGVGPLVGAAGITGVALGFASQTSVSNMISGLFLIAEQPFQINDIITVGDITGTVLSIDLLSVKIRQFDNKFTRIPNELILKSNVTNISRHPIRRVDTAVSVAYKEDIQRVRKMLLEIAADDPDVLQEPEPIVIFQSFGDSGINFTLCAWVVKTDFLKLRNRIPEGIQQRFRAEGIEIPFPHLSLYRGAESAPFEVQLVGPVPPSPPVDDD